MDTTTRDMLHAAEHFIARNARLLDRYRYAHHFQSEPARTVRAVLNTYRNVDGGYGNALHPELRGHGSQPIVTARALRILDELGYLPASLVDAACRYLRSVTQPDGESHLSCRTSATPNPPPGGGSTTTSPAPSTPPRPSRAYCTSTAPPASGGTAPPPSPGSASRP